MEGMGFEGTLVLFVIFQLVISFMVQSLVTLAY